MNKNTNKKMNMNMKWKTKMKMNKGKYFKLQKEFSCSQGRTARAEQPGQTAGT
jgi:hypothetical protein